MGEIEFSVTRRRILMAATAVSAGLLPSVVSASRPSDFTMCLPSGRRLGYRIFGSLDGFPMLYFHGTPGCRLEAGLLAPRCLAQNACLIAVDRPGMGMSSSSCAHSQTTWANDISHLIELLRPQTSFHKFGILAMSGGTSFALACAAELPDKICATAILSPRTPGAPGVPRGVMDTSIEQATAHPWLAAGVLRRQNRRFKRNPNAKSRQLAKFAGVDQRYAERHAPLLRQTMAEAARNGTEGIVNDLSLVSWPWGVCLNQIHTPVGFWIGSCDYSAPIETIHFLQRNIPGSTVTIVSGEGHLSLIDAATASATEWLRSHANA